MPHEDPNPKARIGQMIKTDHPYSYMSGNWFTIRDVVDLYINGGPRACYVVEYVSGDRRSLDFWAVIDPSASYQFEAA